MTNTRHTGFDVLAFGAHPDDVELCAGGTMCLLAEQGYQLGLVDLTRGELGSRGSEESRAEEAAEAARLLGVTTRLNLRMVDGGIVNDAESRRAVIETLRRFRPRVVLLNAPECRHPDHCNASRLVADAAYFSGLRKIETEYEGEAQDPWRPHYLIHYMQAVPFVPSFVVDVSSVWARRIKLLQAFRSQFYNPEYEAAEEEDTYVSNRDFFDLIEARARTYGYPIGARYGEPFLIRNGAIGTTDMLGLLHKDRPFR